MNDEDVVIPTFYVHMWRMLSPSTPSSSAIVPNRTGSIKRLFNNCEISNLNATFCDCVCVSHSINAKLHLELN